MNRLVPLAVTALLFGATVAPACTSNVSVFSDGTGGTVVTTTATSGTGGSTSTSSNGTGGSTSTSSNGTGGTSTSSTGTGGGTSTSTSGTGGGGGTVCPHDICDEGGPLSGDCDPCVGQICGQDPFCCDNNWDYVCVSEVWSICQIDCAPNLIDCTSQYSGGTAGFYLCAQTAEICDFGFNNSTDSCDTVCQSHGGECLGMFNNNGQCGHSQTNYGCGYTGFSTAICVCSRGCGGNPPCGNG
ncbi:MAG: hypothetical protein JRI68_06160, partial [Deltaproteobacteria bacterium]|nr:hypothetical protein [Deltaproteobacteria bacterium]